MAKVQSVRACWWRRVMAGAGGAEGGRGGGWARLIKRFLPLLDLPSSTPSSIPPHHSLLSHPSPSNPPFQPFKPLSSVLSGLVAGPHCLLPPAAPTRRRRLVGPSIATRARSQLPRTGLSRASLENHKKYEKL